MSLFPALPSLNTESAITLTSDRSNLPNLPNLVSNNKAAALEILLRAQRSIQLASASQVERTTIVIKTNYD